MYEWKWDPDINYCCPVVLYTQFWQQYLCTSGSGTLISTIAVRLYLYIQVCSVPQRCINKVRRLWRNTPGSLPLNYIVNFKLFLQSPFQYNFFCFFIILGGKKKLRKLHRFYVCILCIFSFKCSDRQSWIEEGIYASFSGSKGKKLGKHVFFLAPIGC